MGTTNLLLGSNTKKGNCQSRKHKIKNNNNFNHRGPKKYIGSIWCWDVMLGVGVWQAQIVAPTVSLLWDNRIMSSRGVSSRVALGGNESVGLRRLWDFWQGFRVVVYGVRDD